MGEIIPTLLIHSRERLVRNLLDGTSGDGGEFVDDAELFGADVAEGWVLAHLSDDRAF